MLKFRAGIIKRIHVNKHVIMANAKNGTDEAPLTVQTSRGAFRGYTVEILGPSVMVYRPSKPLSCGAKVWIETRAEVGIEQGNYSIRSEL